MRTSFLAWLGLLCLASSAFAVVKDEDFRAPLKLLGPEKSQVIAEDSMETTDDVTTAEPEPSASTAEPEPSVSTAEPEPSASTAEPEPSVSTAEPEPSASTAEPEPSASTAEPEPSASTAAPTIEEEARAAMELMDEVMTEITHNMTLVDWDYETNVTEETSAASAAYATYWSEQYKIFWDDTIKKYENDYPEFEDEDLKRQFELQKNIGTSILSTEDNEELNTLVNSMTNVFSNGRVCPFDNQECGEGEGYNSDDLEFVMANETAPDALLYYWKAWRDTTGKVIKDDYVKYIDLQNKAADQNGFDNAGLMWLDPYTASDYSDEQFKDEIEALWQEVEPLYRNLHAYVRYRLKEIPEYEELMPEEDDPIPAFLLGNMWSQSWENIYELVAPHNDSPLLDISDTLAEKADAEWMFEKAEEFFRGIGLYPMTDDFKTHSLREQPDDNRTVQCHANAWDFYDTENPREDGEFRIKMCTDTNQEDFTVIHHEMGHIEYFMAYSVRGEDGTEKMPMVFRDGANPGFHEAIGDTIALSVSTPAHLQMIKDELNGATSVRVQDDKPPDQDINFLMKQALAKVAFLPFAYILDKWRWDAFSGDVDVKEFNRHWWELRAKYQGIAPNVERDSDEDFDIGCKFHVPQSVPYIRYFVAHILQFQFHKKLAEVAGCESEVYNCDINGNTTAGAHLNSMLMKGASEPWQQQLSDFMEDENATMSAAAIKAYFQPLADFLNKTITQHKIPTGWKDPEKILDKWGMSDTVTIPPTVPIIVGVVLACMICVVIVAYFVGVSKQKKKAANKAQDSSIEMT